MSTNNQVNVGLSGSSGTGSFAGTTSPSFTTPVLGTPTSGTLTNCTGLPIAGTTGYGTGVATALAANVTGSGGIALATSPTFVTPTLGAATATSLTFSPTTGGIVGTTTNNNTTAGDVGEFVSSQVLNGSATSISTTTPTNLTSISLTAGDWDVWGNVFLACSAAVITASYCGINTTSATLPDFSLVSGLNNLVAAGVSQSGLVAPPQRLSLSGTTTVYLVSEVVFGSGTSTQSGFLAARRRR